MTPINSRADLEQLRGTPAFEPALRAIGGALVRKTNIAVHPTTYSDSDYDGPAVPPVWHYEEDQSILARIGMTRAEINAELSAASLPPLVVPADEGEQLDEAELATIDAGVLTRRFQRAIQQHVDQTARERDYSDGAALAGYVTSTVGPWAGEATAFVAWRDTVWLYAFTELTKVQNGERDVPSVMEFIDELPAIEWPPQS